MISRILLRSQRPLQLIVAITGTFFGLFILLASVQFYFDLQKAILNEGDALGADYLVIQKPITAINTFSLSEIGFEEEEIEALRNLEYVEEVGVFEASRFEVFAAVSGFPNAPDMYTNAFFESIPDRFIDVKTTKEWYWSDTSSYIPIILPSAYLDAFNYGFGPSQGLPPFSQKAFRMLKFRIIIPKGRRLNEFEGKICGFSDRINTILTPKSFLDYANNRFAKREVETPARLILAVDDITNPKLRKYLDDHGFETGNDQLKGSRIKAILMILLSAFLFIGGVIIILALTGFIQYSQIIIGKVNYELKVMLIMGYRHTHLARRYILYFGFLFLLIFLASLASLVWAQSWFVDNASEYSLEVEKGLHPEVLSWGAVFLLGIFLINSAAILLNLRRLAKSLQ